MATRDAVREIVTPNVPREEAERRLADYALRIVDALSNGQMSVAQAGEALFSVENYQMIKERRLRGALIELMEWGMELEDVEEAAPEGLEESYAAMRRLAKQVINHSAERGDIRGGG